MEQFTSTINGYVVYQSMYVLGAPNSGGLMTSAAAGCTPVTENYGAVAGTTDYVFLSVTNDGSLTTSPLCSGSGSNGSCLYNFVVDSSNTSSTTLYTAITSPFFAGSSGTITIASGTNFQSGSIQIDNEEWTINSGGTGSPQTLNVTQNSNTIPATHAAGALVTIVPTATPTSGLPTASGSSGIIIDNTSSSTGASQIYFGTLGSQACGTSGTGGCAVQASQTSP
jgi:hypothetical protein